MTLPVIRSGGPGTFAPDDADDMCSKSGVICTSLTSFRPYTCCCDHKSSSIGDVMGGRKSFALELLTLENTLAGVTPDESRGGHDLSEKLDM